MSVRFGCGNKHCFAYSVIYQKTLKKGPVGSQRRNVREPSSHLLILLNIPMSVCSDVTFIFHPLALFIYLFFMCPAFFIHSFSHFSPVMSVFISLSIFLCHLVFSSQLA